MTGETNVSADPPPPPKPRRRWGWLVWLALAVAVAAMRFRSTATSDVIVFGTRAGYVQGVASHRGQLMLALSTLSLGPERSMTVERDAMPCEAFDSLYGEVYAWVDRRKELAGFGFAQTQRGQGIGNAIHAAFLMPHWALAAMLFAPVARRGWRALRARRRGRRGLCRHCGYDLWGRAGSADGVCPECGEPGVATANAAVELAGARPAVASLVAAGATVVLTLALVAGLWLSARLAHPRFADARIAAAEARLQGRPSPLDRPVPAFQFADTPSAEAFAWLSQATDTPIEVDWNAFAKASFYPEMTVTVAAPDGLPLGEVLELLPLNPSAIPLMICVDGSRVRIAPLPLKVPPDAGQYVVRAYDVSPLLPTLIARERRKAAAVEEEIRLNGGRGTLFTSPSQGDARAEAVETLVFNVGDLCEGAAWESGVPVAAIPGGRGPPAGGRIVECGGRLVVSQTEEMHRHVAYWLRALQAIERSAASIEAR